MSVSVTFSPLYYILRAVLEDERVEKWIGSMEKYQIIEVKNKEVLQDIVRGAGYDFEEYASFSKTHLGDEVILWEKTKGQWKMTYSRLLSVDILKRFISELERCSGKVLVKAFNENIEEENITLTLPTNFSEASLLTEVLTNYGVKIVEADESYIECRQNGLHYSFSKGENEVFYIEFDEDMDVKALHETLLTFDRAYHLELQNINYDKIKANISAQSKYSIPNEYVDENDEIVIVLE